MVKSVIIEEFGDTDVLKIKDTPLQKPKSGELLIRHKAIGVNFIDIYQRKGLFKVDLPSIIGGEASGIVEEVGDGVEGFKVGDRVAYATAVTGAYTEARVINHKFLIPLPDYIKHEDAVAILLKGMTAFYLLRRTFFVTNKHTILISAAAGGVGQILCQLAKYFNAKVIATVGSDSKKEIVKSLGVDKVINYIKEDFVKEVMDYTKNSGVHVVYDSVGKDVFTKSLECLCDFGLMVSYGQSSGKIDNISRDKIISKSLFFTAPSLFTYAQYREELLLNSNEVLTLNQQKVIKPNIYKKYNFSDISLAHQNLESRNTTGQSIIML